MWTQKLDRFNNIYIFYSFKKYFIHRCLSLLRWLTDLDRRCRRDYVPLNVLDRKNHISIQRVQILSVQEIKRFLPIHPDPSYNLIHILVKKESVISIQYTIGVYIEMSDVRC